MSHARAHRARYLAASALDTPHECLRVSFERADQAVVPHCAFKTGQTAAIGHRHGRVKIEKPCNVTHPSQPLPLRQPHARHSSVLQVQLIRHDAEPSAGFDGPWRRDLLAVAKVLHRHQRATRQCGGHGWAGLLPTGIFCGDDGFNIQRDFAVAAVGAATVAVYALWRRFAKTPSPRQSPATGGAAGPATPSTATSTATAAAAVVDFPSAQAFVGRVSLDSVSNPDVRGRWWPCGGSRGCC